MGSQPAPAPVIDYNKVAEQQTQANLGSQASSNINQSNPWGNVTYTQTGTSPYGTPIYTANTTLTPEQQQLFNTLQTTQGVAGQAGQSLLTGANYGSTNPTTAIGDMTKGITGQLMTQEVAGLTPYYSAQTQQLDTQLRQQGFKPGDLAYDQAMNGLQQNQNQTVSAFLAQAEPQAFGQATSLYQMPEQMATSLASFGAPGSVTQNLAPTQSVQPANVTGAAATTQQAYEQQYQQQSQNYNAMMQGLFGIPSAVLGGWARSPSGGSAITGALGGIGSLFAGSDIRMKEDVEQIGTLFDGTPVYRFRYAGQPKVHIGLMAQDVEKFAPEAIMEVQGLKFVDYQKATERALSRAV